MKSIVFFILSFLLFACTVNERTESREINQFQDSLLLKIAELQNNGHATELVSFLSHENSTYRWASALCYASIQDSAYVTALSYKFNNDSSAKVRASLAYSLGQIGNKQCFESLAQAYELEVDSIVRDQILESIGKCQLQNAADFLRGTNSDSPGVYWGIYRTIGSGTFDVVLLEKAISGLFSKNPECQLAASHVLNRLRDFDLTPHKEVIYDFITNSDNLDARIAISKSLKWIYADDKVSHLQKLLGDEDYRIIINCIRTISGDDLLFLVQEIIQLLGHSNEQVFEAALRLINSNLDKFQFDHLMIAYQASNSENRKIAIGGAILGLNFEPNINKDIISFIENSESTYEKHIGYKALSMNTSNDHLIVQEFDNTVDEVLRGFLFELLPQSSLSYAFLKGCVAEGDVALKCLAASELHQKEFATSILEDVQFYRDVQASLLLPNESEAWLEINRMLCAFDPEDCDRNLPYSDHFEFNWMETLSIAHDQKLKIKTTKGSFTIKLNVNDSPGSVSKICSLVKEGFYNGKTFHRVVPNFVAQGGCPRGDGWGSMDFSLKSELGPLKYRTGTVGLASAGKDTESCQFFITHSPTPHLDGKYTIIGKVVEGMDVVHQLAVGDGIVSASIL